MRKKGIILYLVLCRGWYTKCAVRIRFHARHIPFWNTAGAKTKLEGVLHCGEIYCADRRLTNRLPKANYAISLWSRHISKRLTEHAGSIHQNSFHNFFSFIMFHLFLLKLPRYPDLVLNCYLKSHFINPYTPLSAVCVPNRYLILIIQRHFQCPPFLNINVLYYVVNDVFLFFLRLYTSVLIN